MGADESKPTETGRQFNYDYNRSPTSGPSGATNTRSPPYSSYRAPYTSTANPASTSSNVNINTATGITSARTAVSNTSYPMSQNPTSSNVNINTATGSPSPRIAVSNTSYPTSQNPTSSNVNINSTTGIPSSRTTVSNTSYPTSQNPTSSNVNINTATGIPPTRTAMSNTSYPSQNLFGTQASTSGINAARVSTPPATTNRYLYPTLQNVETRTESSEAVRNTVASNTQSNVQQTRSVEENVKNFDDVPEFPMPNFSSIPTPNFPQASKLLNVASAGSTNNPTAKTKQAHAKNVHNKGISKPKGAKKNAQGNKALANAEFTRSTISEIENGFNLVTLQESNKTGKANRAERTQNYRNKAQHNGLSQDTISCPICMEPMLGAVFQCISGHSLCEGCNDNLRERVCPSCRIDMTHPVRNRALEDVISKMKIPCPNREKGCIFSLPANNLRDHLNECIYRTMACPMGTTLGCCFWKGEMNDLKDHFQSAHPEDSGFAPDAEMTVHNVNNDGRTVSLIVMGRFNFLLHVKVDMQQQRTYWLIQNVGTKTAAKNWIYEFHFYNKAEPKRKMFYADSCSSDSVSADALFASLRCAMVPYDMLRTFFNAGKLNYKFYIRKTDKERNKFNDDTSSEADPTENHRKGRNNNRKR